MEPCLSHAAPTSPSNRLPPDPWDVMEWVSGRGGDETVYEAVKTILNEGTQQVRLTSA